MPHQLKTDQTVTIARTPDEYADIAVALGRNPGFLARQRAKMRQQRKAGSRFFDSGMWEQAFDRGLRMTWELRVEADTGLTRYTAKYHVIVASHFRGRDGITPLANPAERRVEVWRDFFYDVNIPGSSTGSNAVLPSQKSQDTLPDETTAKLDAYPKQFRSHAQPGDLIPGVPLGNRLSELYRDLID